MRRKTLTTTNMCRLCNQSEDWHKANNPRHPFTPRDGASSPTLTNDQPAVVQNMAVPFDPVLRLCLINAGVITTEQLSKAEKDFRMINGGGTNGGEGSTQSGLPQGQ